MKTFTWYLRSIRGRRGFTLLEMLASVSVFILLVLTVSELLNNTSKVTNSSKNRLDADFQARLALDRIGSDIARIVNRGDVDIFIDRAVDGTKNDEMYFYSGVPGRAPEGVTESDPLSSLSLVGYRIGESGSNNPYKLERFSILRKWDSSGTGSKDSMVFLSYDPAANTSEPERETLITEQLSKISDDDFSVIAEGVFRVEICYLLKGNATQAGVYSTNQILDDPPDSTINASSPPTSPDPLAIGRKWYDVTGQRSYFCEGIKNGRALWRSQGMRDVDAILVTIAVIDSSNLLKIQGMGPTALKEMVDSFPKARDADLNQVSPILPSKAWQEVINKNKVSGIPEAMAASIKIYQRLYYLNSQNN